MRSLSSPTPERQPDDEQYTAGMFAGLSVARGFDALQRRDSLDVPALGALLATGYGYDGASRLQTVTNGQIGATYTREPNSPLLAKEYKEYKGVQREYKGTGHISENALTTRSGS